MGCSFRSMVVVGVPYDVLIKEENIKVKKFNENTGEPYFADSDKVKYFLMGKEVECSYTAINKLGLYEFGGGDCLDEAFIGICASNIDSQNGGYEEITDLPKTIIAVNQILEKLGCTEKAKIYNIFTISC